MLPHKQKSIQKKKDSSDDDDDNDIDDDDNGDLDHGDKVVQEVQLRQRRLCTLLLILSIW